MTEYSQAEYPQRLGTGVGFPRCTDCLHWRWPSGELCRACGSAAIEAAQWLGPARLLAEVRVHRGVSPEFLGSGAYYLVKLDMIGFHFVTRWQTRPDGAQPGQPCALVWGEVNSQPWPLAIAMDASVAK